MKKTIANTAHGLVKILVLSASLVSLNACGEAAEQPTRNGSGLEEMAKSGKILPYYIVFNAEGVPEIHGIDGTGTKIMDVKAEEFPIKAKIKRIETITLLTYEGSCEILIPSSSGYKKIIIQNDAICAKIKP